VTAPPAFGPGRKLVIGLGDHTITLTLAALSLFYVFFLTEYAGIRPALAGLVPLIGRFVDAFTDPLMGRLSDLTRTRMGRRRPYLLLGALPFGLSFAALWVDLPAESQLGRFAYYTGAYVF
jgi:GPH family glycoside/pentoside/hexuronide:cation symporter